MTIPRARRSLLLVPLLLLGAYGLIQALDAPTEEHVSPLAVTQIAAPDTARIPPALPARSVPAPPPLNASARRAPAAPLASAVPASPSGETATPPVVVETTRVFSAAVAAEPVAKSLQAVAAPRPQSLAPATPTLVATLPRKPLDRFTLRYAVYYGEDGIRLGDAIYEWRLAQGRYSLVSTAEAKGVASLFLRGKIIQTSEGRVTSAGLKPERYWLIRKGQKRDVADFDWNLGRLQLGAESLELPVGSQDLLSFAFQLALTADANMAPWRLWVTNGRKLRDYQFRILGRERLKIAGEEVDTFHLRGSHADEDNLDVWLAPARQWLPARIRTLDNKGKVTQMNLEEGG